MLRSPVLGRPVLLRLVTACAVVAAWPTVAQAASPPPTVAITAPAAGATVQGTVTLTASASAGAGTTMSSVRFYDGVNYITSYDCDDQPSCSASGEWRATGLSGQHSLTAVAYSNDSQQTTSAAVPVTVVSPPPTVAITSPATGSTVKGTVTVSASAATDPSQVDYPTRISFYDGVNRISSIDCQGQQTCQGSVAWPATGLTGAHTLTAQVSTNRSVSATSAPVAITVVTPLPTVAITSPRTGSAMRRKLTVRMAAATDLALDDYPTSITLMDGANRIGSVDCQGQPTCSGGLIWDTTGLRGRHTLRAVVSTNRDASATSAAVLVGQAVRGHAHVSCRLSTTHARVRRRVRGTCSIPGVPRGTTVQIKFRRPGGSYGVAVSGTVRTTGTFSFSLKGSKRSTYRLVIVVAANRKYLRTTSSIGTLHVV
jgi:hypothetical protein